ncbi:hypothetical protein KFL_002330090 [Klebsormidium nitens]|uniref:Uncharacterized protein n=1 Tax=Klebsormidium nitens TaxID=105231 RepID=A0A1Y1I7J9_KLENI|nr:hypothetical protein KFL_002330090 [Klebsormidium nitens]|eukprot:GAQ85399.1 hypothetical protein KFL_002330090 [Klebsormidium nitens]
MAATGSSMWLQIAGISGAAAVALGAYGAHAFKPENQVYRGVFQTASSYHLIHSAALLATPLVKRPQLFGALMTAGIVLFSGSCYTVAFTEDRKYGRGAPFGGFALIGAWLVAAMP